jgi:hypothetical protein
MGLPKKIVRGATLRLEFVRCGRCPKQHGPYWYAYWKDYRGVTHKQYIGKHLPESAQATLRNPSGAPTGTAPETSRCTYQLIDLDKTIGTPPE